MSGHTLSVLALCVALLAQFWSAGVATGQFLRKEQSALAQRSWLALAIATLIFALQYAYLLEMAVSTGLYDVRQAVLAAVASLVIAAAAFGFRRLA